MTVEYHMIKSLLVVDRRKDDFLWTCCDKKKNTARQMTEKTLRASCFALWFNRGRAVCMHEWEQKPINYLLIITMGVVFLCPKKEQASGSLLSASEEKKPETAATSVLCVTCSLQQNFLTMKIPTDSMKDFRWSKCNKRTFGRCALHSWDTG